MQILGHIVVIPIALYLAAVACIHLYYTLYLSMETIPVCMCVTSWNQYRKNLFKTCLESLLTNTHSPLSLHLIVDETSREEAREIAITAGRSQLHKLKTYEIDQVHKQFQQEMDLLRHFFGSDSRPYYQKPVFYVAPIIHSVVQEDKLIMLDIDTKVVGDLHDLYRQFQSFNSYQYWGAAYEQSPYYMTVLTQYRMRHPLTQFGSPPQWGNPGINTGVLLVDTEKLQRRSSEINAYWSRRHYEYLVDQYMLRGNLVLGGQDFLSLMSFQYPELFHRLPCTWNRQLCMWFKENGFSDVFESYHRCEYEAKLLHGNCNTTIP